MMTRDADKKREQMMMFSMDDMVPKDHMLRKIDRAIDWNFIYDLVEDKYCADNGRPSMDPVMLIKIPFIQYLYGIKSMRQTIKEIEVNVAYRWFAPVWSDAASGGGHGGYPASDGMDGSGRGDRP